jgi:hypothetical protein
VVLRSGRHITPGDAEARDPADEGALADLLRACISRTVACAG